MIKGGFSYRAKKELEFSGEVWQRGFSDVQIKDEKSYLTHRSYIYDNPARAGLVSAPEEYSYGSLYLRRLKLQGLKPGHISKALRHDCSHAQTQNLRSVKFL